MEAKSEDIYDKCGVIRLPASFPFLWPLAVPSKQVLVLVFPEVVLRRVQEKPSSLLISDSGEANLRYPSLSITFIPIGSTAELVVTQHLFIANIDFLNRLFGQLLRARDSTRQMRTGTGLVQGSR